MSNTTLYVEYMKTVKEVPTVSNTTVAAGIALVVILVVLL